MNESEASPAQWRIEGGRIIRPVRQLPANFDWIKARSECSIAAAFKDLEADAAANVAQRNSQLTARDKQFKFHPGGSSVKASFYIIRDEDPKDSRVFLLDGESITVDDGHNKQVLKATLTLNNEGECRLKVGEEELERWQVLRKALESFFFE